MSSPRLLVTALGDVEDSLAAVPVVRALRQALPGAYIAVLVYQHLAPLWATAPGVDRVVQVRDASGRGLRGLATRAWYALVALPDLWRRFDRVVVSSGGPRSALLALLTGAPERVGVARGWSRQLLTWRIPADGALTPRQANLRVLEALGLPDTDARLRLAVSDADRRAAHDLVARLVGDRPGPLVALHPGSDWGCQMWAFERWARVADHLVEHWGARVLITGLASERWMAERIARAMRYPPAIASGLTTLPVLAALVAHLDLFVGVNAGPVTLCVASGTPAVVVDALYYAGEQPDWGRLPGDEVVTSIVARDDGTFGWFRRRRLHQLKRERRCVNPACIGQGVMSTISVARVIQAADETLAARGHAVAPSPARSAGSADAAPGDEPGAREVV